MAFSLCSVLLLCPGCVETQHATYPPPNLPKRQVATVESGVGVLKVDGETKSPRGFVYAKEPIYNVLKLPPGQHTFLLCARRGNQVLGMLLDYAGDPKMFTLMNATLEPGKKYRIFLRVDQPRLSLKENLSSSFLNSAVHRKLVDAVMLNKSNEIIARAVPALPPASNPGNGNHM